MHAWYQENILKTILHYSNGFSGMQISKVPVGDSSGRERNFLNFTRSHLNGLRCWCKAVFLQLAEKTVWNPPNWWLDWALWSSGHASPFPRHTNFGCEKNEMECNLEQRPEIEASWKEIIETESSPCTCCSIFAVAMITTERQKHWRQNFLSTFSSKYCHHNFPQFLAWEWVVPNRFQIKTCLQAQLPNHESRTKHLEGFYNQDRK